MTSTMGPHLRKTERSQQLIVNGKPFLMLAAELHNSTWTKASYMAPIWQSMKDRHINTLLGPVAWNVIEPVEGQFDFSVVDQIVLDARHHGFRLGILWFGAFKNALSSYAPDWVRRDVRRFPRVHIRKASEDGLRTIEALQPTCEAARDSDAKAFAALMRHLKEIDSEHQTVVLAQVENEIGVMFDARDRSRTTDDLFRGHVPQGLLEHLQKAHGTLHPTFRAKFPDFAATSSGPLTWTEAFGDTVWAEDIFMANAYSQFVQHVAAAGRREYNIPLFVNVALCSEDPSYDDHSQIPEGVPTGDVPGAFPSGGPVGHNMDVYRFNAPDIDFFAPDIYLQDYEKTSECFTWDGLPLFIPEQRRDAYGVRRIWSALANHLALGTSPFGIDSLPIEECHLPMHYGLLSKLSSHILEAQAERPGDLFGFYFDEVEEGNDRTWVKQLGDYAITVERQVVFGRPSSAAGMIIRLPDDTFLCAGYGYQAALKSVKPKVTYTGIMAVEEKDFDEQGNMFTIRLLNGDETAHHSVVILPSEKPDISLLPIPFASPAQTMIVLCKPYVLEEYDGDM